MKKILALAVLLLLIITPFSIHAEKVYVIDNAGLLSEQEAADLEEKLERISAELQADVVALTTTNLDDEEAVAYADDFFDYNGYGQGEHYDGVLLLVVKNAEGGIWYISTSGSGIRAFTDDRIQEAGEEMLPYLRTADYYGAFDRYADLAVEYFREPIGDYMLYDNGDLVTFDDDGNIVTQVNIRDLDENVMYAITDEGKIVEASSLEDPPESYTYFMVEDGYMYEVRPEKPGPEPDRSLPLLETGVSSGVTGLLASLVYVSRERRKLRSVNARSQASEYYRKGSMDLTESRDIFLYRSVSRTRIQRTTTSSGGHSGGGGGGSHVHISSSGHTHGGGGGHF